MERLLKIIAGERRKLECVLRNVSDGICIVDRDFNILNFPVAEQITGWQEAEVIGRHYTASGGLYIAGKLMDSQGGAIWAESQVGRSLPRLEGKGGE
jgi:signal transduction histidine kinase